MCSFGSKLEKVIYQQTLSYDPHITVHPRYHTHFLTKKFGIWYLKFVTGSLQKTANIGSHYGISPKISNYIYLVYDTHPGNKSRRCGWSNRENRNRKETNYSILTVHICMQNFWIWNFCSFRRSKLGRCSNFVKYRCLTFGMFCWTEI